MNSQQNQNAQGQQGGQAQNVASVPYQLRHKIWHGVLEWFEKTKTDQPQHTKYVPCQISSISKDGDPELNAGYWPQKLIMQLVPKHLIGNIGEKYLKDSKSVLFHPQNCEALESFTKVMSSGFGGCVHFTSDVQPQCDIKVIILLYMAERKAYLGIIPNNQVAFVNRFKEVMQAQIAKSTRVTGSVSSAGSDANQNEVPGLSLGSTNNKEIPSSQPTNSKNSTLMSQTNNVTMRGSQISQNVNASSLACSGGIVSLGAKGRQRRMGFSSIPSGNNNPVKSPAPQNKYKAKP